MNKQKGAVSVLFTYGMILLTLATAVAFGVHKWNVFTAKLDRQGYDRGKQETEVGFALRDTQQLRRVIALKDAAVKRADEAEAKAAANELQASTNYQKGVKDGKTRTAALIASGARLRDPGKPKDAGSASGGCSAPSGAPVTAISGGDASPGSELSAEASGFLFRLTEEADTVAKQLNLAQARIASDMLTCNGPPLPVP